MATRFWLTSSAPPYTPTTRRGSWTTATGEDVQLLGRKPAGSVGTSAISLAAGSGTRKVLLHRSISAGAVKAGAVGGTVTWTIGAKESNALLDAVWHVHVYVTSGDTDTPRGTLLSNATGATEFSTTATGATESAVAVTGSVAVQVGDRLVVELGYETSTTTAASYSATINYGGTSGIDLAATDTAVTTEVGWVELSGADGIWTPAIGSLSDTFTSGTIDSAKWTTTGSVTSTGGRARIPCGTVLANLYSLNAYEIQGSALAFQVPTVPAAGGGTGVSFSAYLSPGPTINTTNLEISYSPNTGNLVFRNNVGGTDASPTTITYSGTSHAWWRFREASGQIMMETSPDGATWTTRRTISTPSQWMRLGNLIAYWEAVRGSGTADFAEIDNVNAGGTITIPLGTATETDSPVAATSRRTRTAGVATETDTGIVAAGRRTRAAGTAAETDTARPAPGTKTRQANTAAETDTVPPTAGTRRRTAATVLETDHAQPATGGTRTGRAQTAAETDTAPPASGSRKTTAHPASEANTAQPAASTRRTAAGTPLETDAARAASGTRRAAAGRAPEIDTARPGSGTRHASASPATATDHAQPATGALHHAVSPAQETDTAVPPIGPVRPPLGTVRAGMALTRRWTAGLPYRRWTTTPR